MVISITKLRLSRETYQGEPAEVTLVSAPIYPKGSIENLMKLYIMPVSYTHLDVYKRQFHISSSYYYHCGVNTSSSPYSFFQIFPDYLGNTSSF